MPDPKSSIARRDLPPYTYVPGLTPHPISDPLGHLHGQSAPDPGPLDNWPRGAAYRRGQELYIAGYYWEAHEAWESLWKALPLSHPQRPGIQGLIKLAACGVKCYEGNSAGATRHAQRAAELFQQVPHRSWPLTGTWSLESLTLFAAAYADSAPFPLRPVTGQPQVLLQPNHCHSTLSGEPHRSEHPRLLLFVYGTLKRGFCRNHLLRGEYLGEAQTLPRYRLLDCIDYPGLVESDEGESIHGEIWSVDLTSLSILDHVEGIKQGLYERLPIQLAPPHLDLSIQTYYYLPDATNLTTCGTQWTRR